MVENEKAHGVRELQPREEPHQNKILDLLSGATRSDRDPDCELAQLLAGLVIATDQDIRLALARLVADADPN